MPLFDDVLGGLTAEQADEREKELRQDADDDGVRIALDRVPEPGGLLTLSWRILPPPAPAEQAGGPPGIAAAIRDAALRLGVDERLLGAIAFLESRFDPAAKARTSSARGLFQFLDGTWKGLVDQFGAALGVAAGDRDEIRAQCLVGAKFLQVNSASLQTKLAHRPTPGQCYAGHFLGVAAAAALIRNDPQEPAGAALRRFYASTPAGAAFSDRVTAANAAIFLDGGAMRSVGAVLGVLDGKVQNGLKQSAVLLSSLPDSAAAVPAAGEPAWLGVARAELARGVAEVPGAGSNPRIEEYFTWTRLGQEPDGVAWCGAFASFCLGVTNQLARGAGSARAADWAGFGDALPEPKVGCIAVLQPLAPQSSGHVALWLGTEDGRLRLLGGNQGDRVSVASFPVQKLRAFRWPSP